MRAAVGTIAALLLIGGPAMAKPAPMRLASVSAAPGPCRALDRSASAGERAYFEHLAKRLGVAVQACPVADAKAAGAALAAGQVDMALLDPPAYAAVRTTTRAILTLRPKGGINRIPVSVGVLAAGPYRSLADLKGRAIAFGGSAPAALGVPKAVMAERGAGKGFFGREVVVADEEAAVADLRAGKVEAMALHAAAWQRLCNMVSPKAPQPCADIRLVLKARPQAARALVVRRDMPQETRYRLIGIHLPLHLEAPAAFAWASSWTPRAAEFVPTEAEALTLANISK